MAAGLGHGLIDTELAAKSLSSFACGFGRMEKFQIHGTDVRMILIKNPAGCNQVLNFLTQTHRALRLRRPASTTGRRTARTSAGSGTWTLSGSTAMGDVLADIYVSGVRADDMALRF